MLLGVHLDRLPERPLDQQFLGILTGTSEVDVDDDELTIESSRGELQFGR